MKSKIQSYLLAAIVLCVCAFSFYSTRKPKIMCIDIVKILGQSNEMEQLRKEYEIKDKNLTAKGDTLYSEFQKEIQVFEKNLNSYSEKEKREFAERMELKETQYMNFKKANADKLQEQKMNSTKRVLDKINRIATDYAKSNGYKILLGATGSGNIVYLDDSYDLTDEILKILNRE